VTINWFTVIAQVINFLVLVFLLHRFLYGPIVKTMDKRQEEIAERIQEAEESRREAEEEAEEYRSKQAELDDKRESMMADMRDEIESRRKELMQEIRDESEQMRRQWKDALERNEEEFMRDLRLQISDEFFTLARRALTDLADAELEAQAVKAFLHHIRDLDKDKWRAFEQSLRDNEEPVVVRSAFELPEDLREEIAQTLQENADADLDLHFETDSSLITGIELQAHSHVAAWQLDDYLEELQERAQATLQNKYKDEDDTDQQQTEEQREEQSEEQTEAA
jgi:F-type H+-transporting ATPase subunit b